MSGALRVVANHYNENQGWHAQQEKNKSSLQHANCFFWFVKTKQIDKKQFIIKGKSIVTLLEMA